LEGVASVTAAATAATAVAAATTAAAVTTAATAAVATAAAAAITAAAATATGFGLVDANHPVHPFDVLEVVDGLLFFGIIGELDERKAALPAGFPIERQAALANFSVLTEKVTEILLFGVERKVAYVDCHVTGKNLN
jgi:hypothetical protein